MPHLSPAQLTWSDASRPWQGQGRLNLDPIYRHGLALLILSVAVAVGLAVLPPGHGLTYLTLYPATLLAFYVCGVVPGCVSIAVGGVVGYIIQSGSYSQWHIDGTAVLASLLFVLLSGFMCLLLQRLQAVNRDLGEQVLKSERIESSYLQVLEAQSDVIAQFEPDNTITYVNGSFCDFFGVTRDALIGQSWKPIPVEEDLDRVNAELALLTPGHSVVVIENRVNTPRGVRWVQFINKASFGARGELLFVQSVGRDITERKELEKRLADTMAGFKDLYDHAPCGYYSLDRNGTIISANEITLKWLGLPAEQVLGQKRMVDFFTHEGKKVFEANFPVFIRTGRISGIEFDLVSVDGTLRRMTVDASAIFDSDGAFVMSRSVMSDVTEMRSIERRLRKLTAEQEAMLNNELTGITKLSNRRFLWANAAMHRIFGYSTEELQGRSARMLYLNEASFQTVGSDAYPLLRSGGLYRAQLQMAHKDGHPICIDLQGAALAGEPDESIWVFTDITQLRKSLLQKSSEHH